MEKKMPRLKSLMRATIVLLALSILTLSATAQGKNDWEKLIHSAKHDSVRLRLYFQFSEKYHGNPKLSKDLGLKALKYVDATDSPTLKVRVIQNAAILCWQDGEYAKSILLQEASLQIAQKNKLHFWAGKAFHFIGLNHYYLCNYDTALNYYTRAVKEYELAHDSVYLSKIENHTAQVLDQMGDYVGATQHILRSMEMQESIPGFNNFAYDFGSTAKLNDTLMYRSSIEKLLVDLSFERTGRDSFKIAQVLRNVAADYANLGEYKTAFQFLNESVVYYEAVDFNPYWLDFGWIYLTLRKYDSAFYYARLWVNAQRNSGTRNLLAAGYAFSGVIHLRMNNFDSALHNYEMTLAINEELGNRIWVVENKVTMARIYASKGNFQKSLALAESALILANEIKSLPKQADCYRLLAEIYSQLGQFEKALFAQQRFYLLDKQITKGEAHMAVAKLGLQYRINKRDKEVKTLQQENLLKETQIESRNLQILLAIIVIVTVATSGGFYFKSYRSKKRTAELLGQQNSLIESKNLLLQKQNIEKEVLLSEIHHRVKNNLQIISSLINLKARQASSETTEALQQLSGRIFSMGLIHEKLYRKEDIQNIRLDEYLEEVCRNLISSFEESEHPISLKSNCNAIEIDADRALNCGLIVNELITNSMKYAFTQDQQEREIAIALSQNGDTIFLDITDNGRSDKPRSGDFKKSFGLRFVDQLVNSKLSGEWSTKTENGFQAYINFKLNGLRKN